MIHKKSLGIYLHIPFCIKKCGYCDFCSYPDTKENEREAYVEALCRDIEQRGELCREHIADTVYFGGGTPTILTGVQFERIFSELRKNFSISDNAEITVECNPKTADKEKFSVLRSLGANRLSMGMQSAHDAELKALGRAHTSKDFVIAFEDARSAGFDNISADVMFGIPNQTEESFKRTLELLTSLEPEHISAYGLILEEGTPFFANREKLVLPSEDSEYNMYTDAVGFLARHGYERYEISNFSKPDRESAHNMKYWMRDEYVGLGASAHSFLGEKRSFAPADISAYVRGQYEEGCEEVSENDAMCEYVMLAMRTTRGVGENVFYSRFGKDFYGIFGEKLKPYRDGGFVVRKDGRWVFTDSGFYVSNSILSDILSFEG